MLRKNNLTEYLPKLYRLHAFGIKFGLEAETALLDSLGNPQQGQKIIHVAGTNGKGSVCALLAAALRAAGFKTGLYTSPHLVRVNERIQVNGVWIGDEDLAALIDLVDAPARAYAARKTGREITFFEFLTALAFEYFRRQNVEVIVLETGLGGRLDATNVIAPQVAAITSIGLEHTRYLGPDLAAIAAEKGGIIKANAPVVVGALPEAALAVLQKQAREKNARLVKAAEVVAVSRQSQTVAGQKIRIESAANSYGTVCLPLLGAHQLGNTAVAVAALEEFCQANARELSPAAVKKGFGSVAWPGRFQVIAKNPVTILDGAHNPEAAAVLNKTLKELSGARPVFLILGMCADKDADHFLRNLTVPVRKCWIVGLANERGLPPEQLAEHARQRGWQVALADVPQALAEAQKQAGEQAGLVCITGSFYLAGEILARQPAGARGWNC